MVYQAKKLLILFLAICFTSCELLSKEARPKLPRAMIEGKNTFGCLVNGKVFVNERTSFFGGNGTHADLQISGDTVGVNIYAASESDGDIIMAFYDVPELQVNKSYNIADVLYIRGVNNCDYDFPVSGYIKLSKVDTQKSIISGTFELKAYSTTCKDTVTITEGRFDIREIFR